MKTYIYPAFLLLLLLGNFFALYKMFSGKAEFLASFPRLTERGFNIIKFLPAINIVALAGLWFMKGWAPYLVLACGFAVIALDIYFGIYYHLYVAVPANLILLFFIIKYWNEFK